MDFVTAIAWTAIILSAFGLISLYRVARVVHAHTSQGPAKCSCASRVSQLEADVSELQSLLQKIDARDRMRKVRAARDTTDAEPNAFTDPEGWKKHMRRMKALGG